MENVATAYDVSKHALVILRSKINVHWSRFKTRARKHYYTSVDFVYSALPPVHALCFLFLLFSIFRQPFEYAHTPRPPLGGNVRVFARGGNAKRRVEWITRRGPGATVC